MALSRVDKLYRQEKDQTTRYFADNGLQEPKPLRKLREVTMTIEKNMMLSAPEGAQLLRLLLKLMGAKKAIEVGVYTGYNALSMAMALPPDGKVFACDITDEYYKKADLMTYMKEAGVENKVEFKIQQASKSLEELLATEGPNSFDFMFIDADKTNYDTYYELGLKLLRPGGVIAIDNVFWGGKVLDLVKNNDKDTVAIDQLNKKVHTDERVEISMLPISDGLTFACKL